MKVILLFLGLVIYSLGHGGVYYPIPRGGNDFACSPSNPNSTVCGQTVSPCGSLVSTMGPYSYATLGSTFELLFYQLFGHAASGNYYEVLLLNTTSDTYVSLGQTPQANGTDGITVPISVTIPANFPSNYKTSLQVLFNAGASGTYYSCADLWLNPYCPQKTCLKNIGDSCTPNDSPGTVPAECNPKTSYCNAKNVCAAWSAGATCYGTCDQADDSSSDPILAKATPPKFYCKITGASGVCTATSQARPGVYCNEANGIYCQAGYFCYYGNQTCQPYRVYGESCSETNSITDTLCTPTLSCLNNTCNLPYFGNEGEKCAYDKDCAPGLGCNAALGNVCDKPTNVGKNCTLNNADVCYSGSSCSCASVEATNVTCVDTTYPSGCVNYLRTFNDCVMGKTTHTWNECINEASCAYSCSLVQNPMYSYSTGNCYTVTQLTDCTTPPDTSSTTDSSTTDGSDASRMFASVVLLLVFVVAALL